MNSTSKLTSFIIWKLDSNSVLPNVSKSVVDVAFYYSFTNNVSIAVRKIRAASVVGLRKIYFRFKCSSWCVSSVLHISLRPDEAGARQTINHRAVANELFFQLFFCVSTWHSWAAKEFFPLFRKIKPVEFIKTMLLQVHSATVQNRFQDLYKKRI